VNNTKTVKEAYVFLLLTLAFSYFVFWGPLALFKIPTISFVSDVKDPFWAIGLYAAGGFVPSLLAIFLTWKKEGVPGLRRLGQRILQVRLGWRGYLFIILIVFTGTAGQLAIHHLLGNFFDGTLFWTQIGSFLPLLILGPLSEEIGWRWLCTGKASNQVEWDHLIFDNWFGLGLVAFAIVSDGRHFSV